MTFNNNLGNDYGSRGSSGGSGGGSGFGGGGFGRGGGNRGGGLITTLLFSVVGRKFGIPGLIVVAGIVFFMNGGMSMFGGGSSQNAAPQQDSSAAFAHCDSAEAANNNDDCRTLATQTSLDQFWSETLPQDTGIEFQRNELTIADGALNTGCGQASIDQTGPFYCPGDQTIYTSTQFYDQLKNLGGSDGPFAQMYVTAHEVGHHIQNLQGTLGLSDYNDPGPESNAVKIELQADCYAGLWGSHADKGSDALLEPITQEQVEQAISTAQAIGDDHIQESSGQSVNSEEWTHGSSQQRADWFMRGYQGGTMDSCKQSFNE